MQWKKNSWAQQDYRETKKEACHEVTKNFINVCKRLKLQSNTSGTHKMDLRAKVLSWVTFGIPVLHRNYSVKETFKKHTNTHTQLSSHTCGLMPVRNLPETKPPAPGAGSYGWKHGKNFPEGISGGLRPSNSIWPSKHEIWNTHTHTQTGEDICRLTVSSSWGFIEVGCKISMTKKLRWVCGGYLHGVYSGSLGSWLDHQLEVVVWERGVESNWHAHLQTHTRQYFIFVLIIIIKKCDWQHALFF